MNVSQPSKDTYFDIQYEGLTQGQQRKILSFLHATKCTYTRAEIARALGMDKGSVAGRVNLMVDVVLEEGPRRKCRVSGRNVGTVKVKKASS